MRKPYRDFSLKHSSIPDNMKHFLTYYWYDAIWNTGVYSCLVDTSVGIGSNIHRLSISFIT